MTDVPVVFGSGFNIFGDRIGKVGEDASSQGDEVGYVMAKKITSAYQFYTDPYAYECATKGKGMLTVKEKQKVDDDTFEAMTYLIPYGTIFKGAKLTFMGLSTVSKASVGLKVLGEASKGTLRSSLYFTGLLNKHGLNYTVRNWPVLIGPRAKTLGTFLGRNSALIGGGTMGAGGLGVYGLNWLYSDDD